MNTFTIGLESSKIGKPCNKCEKPFEKGDTITTRLTNNRIMKCKTISYHKKCWDKLFI